MVVDLFAGAGGLSRGFELAGFNVVQALESDARAADTFRANHPLTNLVEARVQDLDPEDCAKRIGLKPGELYAMIGGPPCQGFSESNRRTRSISNPNNHLYLQFIRFAGCLRPNWVVIENVAGLRTLAGGAILHGILSGLAEAGYKAEWRELNAAHFGVPQTRRRLFIIGNRIGHDIPWMTPTHGPQSLPVLTVRDAIGDLPAIENGARLDVVPYSTPTPLTLYQSLMREGGQGSALVTGNLVTRNAPFVVERYRFIPAGGNWQDIPPRLLNNYKDATRCHTGIYHRLSWDSPAKVIGNFRKNMLIHPEQHRGLSVREAARLQSFADNYTFAGLLESQQQQVADAVPPFLAAAVARAILHTSLK